MSSASGPVKVNGKSLECLQPVFVECEECFLDPSFFILSWHCICEYSTIKIKWYGVWKAIHGFSKLAQRPIKKPVALFTLRNSLSYINTYLSFQLMCTTFGGVWNSHMHTFNAVLQCICYLSFLMCVHTTIYFCLLCALFSFSLWSVSISFSGNKRSA